MRGLGIGVVVAAFAVAACGGGDEPEALPDTVQDFATTAAPEGRALQDWQVASRSICNEYNPRIDASLAELEAKTTIEGQAAALERGLVLSLEYVERLRAIPVPAERTRPVEQVNDRLDRGLTVISSQLEDLRAGNYRGLISQLGVFHNYLDTDDLYLSLDVPECAPNAE